MASLSCTKLFDGSTWSSCDTMTWAAYGVGSSGVDGASGANVWAGNTGPGNTGVVTTAYFDPATESWATIDAELPEVLYNIRGSGGAATS